MLLHILPGEAENVRYRCMHDHSYHSTPELSASCHRTQHTHLPETDPYKVLDRLDKPFFVPEAAFEKSGQYKDGTVFIEGLAYLKNKLYLYYGCADSQVAVAVCDDNIDSKL